MRALTVIPKQPGSARLDDFPEPSPKKGAVLVQALALGICGTDNEIIDGEYGEPPPGHERLILGHESLGRVIEAPKESGLAEGDLVVGIVRHPDPVPCPNCAAGEWDMCRNGQFTEHGIKALDGFGSERWRVPPGFAVKVDEGLGELAVLLEPASILAKAWEHIERIGARAVWNPRRVLVTGSGPIGLLAALMGVQRGLEVHVLDRNEDGPKPKLIADLGATHHASSVDRACLETDIVIECTGAPQVIFDVMGCTAPGGIACLTGISSGSRKLTTNIGELNNELVLENSVVFGTVNANRRHYEQAAVSLARADRSWLERLITRRVPLDRWQEALDREDDDVKVVLSFDS